jgi:ribonuclease BN (tRNA processing enzyme)
MTDKDILMPALGYKVLVGETTVAFTGDSRMCQSLEDLVTDVDLAIIESTYEQHPNPDQKVHLTEIEARDLSKKAKEHLLIHKKPEAGKDVISPR